MADLWTPRNPPWVDGDDATATNFANRVELGMEAFDVALDEVSDRVDALAANSGTAVGANALVVTTATRGTPTKGRIVFDSDLGKFIGGYGIEWKNLDGTALTTGGNPDPGTSPAPTGMTAVVNPDNSIQLNWAAVSGASHYKLYEIRSPNGVSGADNLTTTSSLRTPSSMGNYDYWVTAFVNGIESAASNHATCVLPYDGGGGGGGGGATPAQLLALGAGGGKFNLGVGYPSGHVDIAPATLEGGWTEAPYFYVNSAGTKVHFQVPMNGGTTSANTHYARCELREYIGSSKAAWSGSSGTHLMSYRATVIHMEADKPEIVIGQIHDGSDDTLQIRCEGTTWRASINGTEHPTTLGNFAWGTEVAVEIKVVNGNLTIKINGTTKITTNPGWGSGQYYKIGAYAQQNSTDQNNPPNGYASCEIRDLVVSHS
jgi:hypothetical protein